MTAKRIMMCEVCEDGSAGGSHQSLYDTCLLLDRSRYEPVLVFYQENRFSKMLEEDGFEVHTWDAIREREKAAMQQGSKLAKLPRYWEAIARRRDFIRDERIDLVHMNNNPIFGLDDWLPAAKLSGIPCVANVMGRPYDKPTGVMGLLARQYARIMPVSEHVDEEIAKAGWPAEQVTSNRIGVDLERFRARADRPPADVRAEFGIAPDKILVLMVGNLQEWKGHGAVMASIDQLPPKDREKFFFLFAGAVRPEDEAYLADLEAVAANGGFSDQVHFAGSRTDVPSLGRAADLMLHASTEPEPFGLVLVEALALGKPLMAAAIGGPLEVLTPECGRLFDPAVPQELCDVLLELGADASLRERMGVAATARSEMFTSQRTADGFARLYEELLGG